MRERLGRFAVPRRTLEKGDALTVIKYMTEIKGIYFNMEKDEFVYLAICRDFDLIGPENEIPEYEFVYDNTIEVRKLIEE